MQARLNDHLIRWLTKHITGKVSGITYLTIEASVAEYFSDCVMVSWDVNDVEFVAHSLGVTDFYVSDSVEVLRRIEKNMNAELGVNWDVIRMEVQEYLAERDEGLAKDRTKVTSGNAQSEGQ